MKGFKEFKGNKRVKWVHCELVGCAAAWLQQDYAVVITELTTGYGEQPDAIGFGYHGNTAIIECKATRADFKSDAKKLFRKHPERGMGTRRYYMCMPGLIKPEELPEGWGLLYVHKTQVRRPQPSASFASRNTVSEMALLVSALRRIGQNPPEGVKVRAYTYSPHEELKATIGVKELP